MNGLDSTSFANVIKSRFVVIAHGLLVIYKPVSMHMSIYCDTNMLGAVEHSRSCKGVAYYLI